MDKWFILSNVDILLLISDKIRLPIQLLLSDSVFTERFGRPERFSRIGKIRQKVFNYKYNDLCVDSLKLSVKRCGWFWQT